MTKDADIFSNDARAVSVLQILLVWKVQQPIERLYNPTQ